MEDKQTSLSVLHSGIVDLGHPKPRRNTSPWVNLLYPRKGDAL